MNYYAIGDIHGCYDKLMSLLDMIYSQQTSGTIIFLGDYVDRGPDTYSVIKALMYPPENWNFICLKGNHEDMLLGHIFNEEHIYDPSILSSFPNGIIPFDMIQWMQKLKHYHIVGNNIFVHADWDEQKSPENQNETRMLWTRRHKDFKFSSVNTLIHGHTPDVNGPWILENRINLDTGAVFPGGKLTAGVFNVITNRLIDILQV